MNRKLQQVLDGELTSDIMRYFDEMDNIIEANGGIGDAKTLTIDASDPPCPRAAGQFTKVKITDDAIHITNIDKSSLGMQIDLEITPSEDFWSQITNNEPVDTPLTDFTPENEEQYKQENERRANIAFAKKYRNKMTKWFVGLKSSIHAIESYRVFSDLKKTNCEQAEALYETACQRMLKPQEELEHKPQIYTLWKNANDGNDTICGTYFTLQDLIDAKARGDRFITVTFQCTVPLDDFLPFSAMTLFPNKIFENLMLEIKLGLTSNIVLCQVDPKREFERIIQSKPGGSAGAEKALYLHLQMDVPNYSKRFTQMGDEMVSTIYSINDDMTVTDNSVCTKFTCTTGSFYYVRSFINGFNIKSSLLEALKQKYREKELLIPAQICDFMAFGQQPTETGMKCNCTYGLTNVSSLMFLFPRTPNELTCSENPHMSSIQVQIDSKPYPDKTISTIEPAHTIYNLTNSGLDGLFSPNEEFANSLVFNEMIRDDEAQSGKVEMKEIVNRSGHLVEQTVLKEGREHYRAPYRDNTSYCFVVSTERLGGYGNFCDGLTRDNCQITLSASTIGPPSHNPYVYDKVHQHPACWDGQTVANKTPAKMIICQDCFWEFRVGQTARWVANDKHYYEDKTNPNSPLALERFQQRATNAMIKAETADNEDEFYQKTERPNAQRMARYNAEARDPNYRYYDKNSGDWMTRVGVEVEDGAYFDTEENQYYGRQKQFKNLPRTSARGSYDRDYDWNTDQRAQDQWYSKQRADPRGYN